MTTERNWHTIEGPNGMCACGLQPDGSYKGCGELLEEEIVAREQARSASRSASEDIRELRAELESALERERAMKPTILEYQERDRETKQKLFYALKLADAWQQRALEAEARREDGEG